MSVIPQTRLGQIEFCEQHIPVWTPAAAQIGLQEGDVTDLGLLSTAARTKYNAALAARQASKAATLEFHSAVEAMRDKAAELVRVIKTFADTSDNPGVYAIAQIPPPQAPAPPTPPGQPESITIGLNPDGSLLLRWKASNAAATSGVYFAVSRRIGLTGNFATIGGTSGTAGNRQFEFVDASLPLGTQQATYIIQGHRGALAGKASDAIVVQFGVGGGTMTVTGGTLTLAA